MSFGLLFSGQGTQHPAMMPWLDDDDHTGLERGLNDGRSANVLSTRHISVALQVPSWREALQDPAWSARNENAQLLLTAAALAAWARLAPHLPEPAGVAGYSVGELPAFCCAGVFDAHTALRLAGLRAQAMDRAAHASPGGLMSISGVREAVAQAWCRGHGCVLAIRIAADSVVAGGPPGALAALQRQALAEGAKCSLLNVAVPSHTAAMQPAAETFRQVLRTIEIKAPLLPLFCNATGDAVHSAAEAAGQLAAQIAQTVQWSACLDGLRARHPRCVLEIGPGSALAAMWNRRHPDVPARSVDEFRSAASVLKWVGDRLRD